MSPGLPLGRRFNGSTMRFVDEIRPTPDLSVILCRNGLHELDRQNPWTGPGGRTCQECHLARKTRYDNSSKSRRRRWFRADKDRGGPLDFETWEQSGHGMASDEQMAAFGAHYRQLVYGEPV